MYYSRNTSRVLRTRVVALMVIFFILNFGNSVFAVERPSAPYLAVSNIDANSNVVSFTWDQTTNTTEYDLRILQNDIVIKTEYGIQGTSYALELPVGNYSAYLCSVNSTQLDWWTASNSVDFTVNKVLNQIVLQVGNQFITVNNAQKAIDTNSDTVPRIVNGRVLLPVRALVEAMGGTVQWLKETSQVKILYQDTNLLFTLNSRNLIKNGETIQLDVPPMIFDGRTYIPVRALIDNLGATLEWNDITKSVSVNYYSDLTLTVNNSSQVVVTNVPVTTPVANPVNSPTISNVLKKGETLKIDQYIQSPNGQYKLIMQSDGNLVLYENNMNPVWASNTSGNPGAYLVFQSSDSNLVLYNSSGVAKWSTNVFNATYYTIQDDRNFVGYNDTIAIWSSKTNIVSNPTNTSTISQTTEPVIGTISQYYGQNPDDYIKYNQVGHNGIDIACPSGTPVRAIADGVIKFEGYGSNFSWMGPAAGICIMIDHSDVYSGYAHLSSTIINIGDRVTKGQIIGYSGSTGASTGPHLHFEILPHTIDWKNGYFGRINPINYIR